MGGSDTEASEKAPKASTAVQEQTPAAPSYADWSSFQAYSPIPHPGYFPPPMASGSLAQPYMWGPQPIMSPYGTPPHPYVMYPGGMYAHPSFPPGSHPFNPYAMPSPNNNAEATGATPAGGEGEGKSSESKEKSPMKNSKESLGSLNMITGKNNNDDPTKISANGGFSHSGESGSGDSCEGSDANSHNEDSQPKISGGQDSLDGPLQNGNHAPGSQNGVNHTLSQTGGGQIIPIPESDVQSCTVGPTTNLNIGMDYWSTATAIPMAQHKVPLAAIGGAMASGGPSEPWMMDERELKRQKRKQSNRESARRSRLRKQAECEELAQKVEVLKEENASLKAELNRIRAEYEQLYSHNALLKEKLGNSTIDINGKEDDTEGSQ